MSSSSYVHQAKNISLTRQQDAHESFLALLEHMDANSKLIPEVRSKTTSKLRENREET